MTVAYAVPVTRCDQSTMDVCTIYLVGGFDENRNFYPGHPDLRAPTAQTIAWGYLADEGDVNCLRYFAAAIKCMLAKGSMNYRGRDYRFRVDVFEKEALVDLVYHVIAQVTSAKDDESEQRYRLQALQK
ncbi:hypothetical protein [Pseudomonas aeruginosa]|uniref:hypothetical protein n=1 Tax=Pseudomonas aeruginosa TaxID=287 RepID=UPI0032E476AD